MEKMDELISIVVPVYNVEPYLRQCLESISIQNYKNLEIILVDDGSTDRSRDICEEYAGKDKRFYVIHQGNAGVCAARWAGIQKASGTYIGFVDSDDWIAPETYKELHDIANITQADIVMCGIYIYDDALKTCHGGVPPCRGRVLQ